MEDKSKSTNFNALDSILSITPEFTNLSSIQKKRKKIKKIPLNEMNGVLNHIIIWEYFINQKRIFTEITNAND